MFELSALDKAREKMCHVLRIDHRGFILSVCKTKLINGFKHWQFEYFENSEEFLHQEIMLKFIFVRKLTMYS